MHAIEDAKAESLVSDLSLDTAAGDCRDRALVVDAMAVLQSMKKTPTLRTLADLRGTFVRRIENMLNGFNEGRIVFDHYLGQSLKNKNDKTGQWLPLNSKSIQKWNFQWL